MDRIRTRGIHAALVVTLMLTGILFISGVAQDEMFLDTHYYRIPMGTVALDIPTLIDAAQASGYAVFVRSAEESQGYRGDTEVEADEAELLAERPLLYVDRGLALVALTGTDYDLTLRPAADGYELILSPHRPIPVGTTFGSALTQLFALGIVGSSVGVEGPDAFEKTPMKGPRPPEGVPLDSELYGLVVAEDWFDYASSRQLIRVGLRVEVIAEKLPDAIIPADFQGFLVEETEQLARFLVPIHELVDLASSGAFRLVRTAYEPQPTAG
jgi:hypothetical protein